MILLVLLLAFAPGIFWAYYFYKKDKLEPEPKGYLIQMFIYGILVAAPIIIIEYIFNVNRIITGIIVAPIVEEFFKFLTVRHTVFRKPVFNEPMDGIVYASAVALGFASIENFLYLLPAYHNSTLFPLAVMRALLSVPSHALFSSMWGYALGIYKFRKKHLVLPALIISMALHSLFNALALIHPVTGIFVILLVIISWQVVHKKIRSALDISPFRKR